MNKSFTFRAFGVSLAVALLTLARVSAVTFTTNTTILPADTNYDGQDIIVDNCIVLVDGAHSFSSILVTNSGMLTHMLSFDGLISVPHFYADEPQVLTGTNAITLSHPGFMTSIDVTDMTRTIDYLYGVDYTSTTSTTLQRTTNSAIPDGATVLVSYVVNVSQLVGMNLSVTGNVEVVAGASINVSGRGYQSTQGPGAGGQAFVSPISGGGGGHAGYGGNSSGNAFGGATYGSFIQPVTLGSGGGYGSGGPSARGGSGGGTAKIVAGGAFILNGAISADGADATNNRSGGGAGGSVWLVSQTISGAGSITANGGAGEPIHGGGGAGGRIALQADTNNFSGSIAAHGAPGWKGGGAGTIYTKLTSQNGKLLVDNGGMSGTNTSVFITDGTTDLTVRSNAVVGSSNGSMTVGNLLVSSNAMITSLGGFTFFVNVTCTGDAIVENGGRIAADALNVTGSGNGTATVITGTLYNSGGGGHGGYGGSGGSTFARGGTTLTDPISGPNQPGGAGGGTVSLPSPIGGYGGGTVRLIVNGKLTVDGNISANGKAGNGTYGGGGAGGSVWLTLGSFAGSGTISANGGAGVLPGGGGGGGGRIAVFFNTNSFNGTITAYGGSGTNSGGAGTIYLKNSFESNSLLTLNNGGNAGTNTPLLLNFPTTDVFVDGKANLVQLSGLNVRNFHIGPSGLVAYPGGFGGTVAGDFTIDAGGVLNFDGGGSVAGGGGQGTGTGIGGGGHGGFGGANTGGGGAAFDTIIAPLFGGGGGSYTTAGQPGGPGAGGGSVAMTINGNMTVNGTISVNGKDADPSLSVGGGAGGSVFLTCGSLSGSGLISANGGNGSNGGGGGGGRIAIQFNTNVFSGTITAKGGNGVIAGGAGTIYTRFKNPVRGDLLLVDNGGVFGTNTPFASAYLGYLSSVAFDLLIRGGASVMPLSPLPLLSNLTVEADGKLTSAPGQPNVIINVAKDVNVLPGGTISVVGKGYAQSTGPGAGSSFVSTGSGGGYGGFGGASTAGAPGGSTNGSTSAPVDRGSGGGAGTGAYFGGSEGGGAIRLTVGGTLKVEGSLTADGNPGLQDNSGGGAGGSLWVIAGAVAGNGVISADGGSGELFAGGGGGGGRIAIYTPSNSFAGSLTANGGIGAFSGGVGSLLLSGNLPTVQGTVTDTNGQPVSGVLISADNVAGSAATGVDGKYTLTFVPYANFTVHPSFPNFLFVPGARSYATLSGSISNADYLMLSSFAPSITGNVQGTNIMLNWFAMPGVTYQLFSSTNLADWFPYGVALNGSNVVLEVPVPVGGDPQKFFRVQAGN